MLFRSFALFFLRSVAPEHPYVDKVTGRKMAPVTSSQIYFGAIPYVLIQLLMVATVLAFPGLVTHYKDGRTVAAPSSVNLDVQPLNGASPFGAPGAPAFGNAGADPFAPAKPPGPTAPGGLPPPDFSKP